MSLTERQKNVVALWRTWRKNMRDLNDGWFPYYDTGKQIHLFYEYLGKSHPSLLDMPKENPYLVIKAWVERNLDL
ncbi:hypothetical protein [Comamonas odontotermitis]|uniref:hypothetical protein n=1 Tax=Comamonas odontotermitis TaxID=379895 RepID=UPI001CC5E1EE|nr:hypothetical protein [Comamonas odontotermitis]UBB15399.1 hypothetical protein LAD35_10990 [Comamonas odontotermitis]